MAEKDVTRLLEALNRGETDAFEDLFAEVYPSLREMAKARLRSQRPGATLNPTALVHEAYVKMVRYQDMEWKGRTYFFGAAARVMRNILVDYARAKGADKRKGIHVSLTQAGLKAETVSLDTMIEIDRALERLAQERPRWVQVVECRYFSGLTIEETARALDLAESTVSNDWRLARAWLQRELSN
jgi:RNA polymerase sigma factor (TIGR02999 family)